MGSMMDGDMCLGMGLAMGLGTLVWTVLLVSLVAAATLLVVRAVGRPVQLRADVGDRSDDWAAESELRMRYARGELDREDFQRRMHDLQEL